ncbi:unnamed protein product [Cylicocyclus nassatus]|uniref:Uncharacterized protein n=1 Tax=Cylicocyclus nassatus TaxID=53992 RepID=A0AA36MA95_CYLNA|nr:unnamed protein product [Cylicocyclus nassatus]
MAGPVPYRTNENKYTPSFPPIVYYRDTFGLEPINDRDRKATESGAEGSDNDSIVTKSTVRTTMNVQPFAMADSMGSKFTNMTPSYHVEQLLTNHVLTADPRTLLTLSLIAFASAIQVIIFAIICVFYDGCPYYIALVVGCLMLCNAIVVTVFCKCRPTRGWLIASCIAASLSFVQSVSLFFWTAYLVNNEDKYLERIGAKENRVVTSTRIAMYSLQMIFAPIHAIAAAIIVFLLYGNLQSLSEEKVTHGYFLSEPQLGHQRILVPIELRQVRDVSDDETENASVGVQTSGTRTQQV